jgi:hypothetical protein
MIYVYSNTADEAAEVLAVNVALGNTGYVVGHDGLGNWEVRVWANEPVSVYMGKNAEGLAIYQGKGMW